MQDGNKVENNRLISNAIWVIYFVGFDDSDMEPFVGFERIETSSSDAHQRQQDAQLAALLRGGQVLAVVDEDDREKAQALAAAFEREILRTR